MGTTKHGYTYPEDSDPLPAGAGVIKSFATAVETNLRASAAGKVNVTVSNAATGQAAVTFPTGRFKAAPMVVITPQDSSVWVIAANAITATGFTAFLRQYAGASLTATVVVGWVAIEA